MIACLDACVLYPTVLRQILLGVARRGLFRPIWSARILEEWARAAARIEPAQEVVARGEIARLRADWPEAEIAPAPGMDATLWLPDPADIHVLECAISGQADTLITLNLRDFPRRELAAHNLHAQHPDAVLYALWLAQPDAVAEVVNRVHAEACRLSGENLDLRGLLKRARLPRLGKALCR